MLPILSADVKELVVLPLHLLLLLPVPLSHPVLVLVEILVDGVYFLNLLYDTFG